MSPIELTLFIVATLACDEILEAPLPEPEPTPIYRRAESDEEALAILQECWGSDDWRECPAVKVRRLR